VSLSAIFADNEFFPTGNSQQPTYPYVWFKALADWLVKVLLGLILPLYRRKRAQSSSCGSKADLQEPKPPSVKLPEQPPEIPFSSRFASLSTDALCQ
jgi:hypothetical protein